MKNQENINDFISDIKTVSECLYKMKELAKEKISDSNINVRHMADLMYRYSDRIEKLIGLSKRNTIPFGYLHIPEEELKKFPEPTVMTEEEYLKSKS